MIYKIKDWRFVTKKPGLKEKKLGGQVLNYWRRLGWERVGDMSA